MGKFMASVDAIATLSERIAKLEEADRRRSVLASPLPVATRFRVHDLRSDVTNIRIKLVELERDMAKSHATLIRWFIGWALSIIAVMTTIFGIGIGIVLTRLP